jgi:flagellar hook-length control protein FliK
MPGVAGQLVQVLSAPRPAPGGSYTVTIALRPEALGEVHATVTANQDQVSVRLVAGTSDGADAIRRSLPELHEALAAEGRRAAVSVSGGGLPRSSIGQGAGGDRSGVEHHAGDQTSGQSEAGAGRSPTAEPGRLVMRSPSGDPAGPTTSSPPTVGLGTGPAHLVDVRV